MDKSARKLDGVFEALAHHHRRSIIHALSLQPRAVSQLASNQNLSLPAIHKHIRILIDSGFVVEKKIGRVHFLALRRKGLLAAQEWLFQYHAYWGNDTESLENYIANLTKKSTKGGESK